MIIHHPTKWPGTRLTIRSPYTKSLNPTKLVKFLYTPAYLIEKLDTPPPRSTPPQKKKNTRGSSKISTTRYSTHLVLQDPTSQLGEKTFMHQFTWLAPETPTGKRVTWWGWWDRTKGKNEVKWWYDKFGWKMAKIIYSWSLVANHM